MDLKGKKTAEMLVSRGAIVLVTGRSAIKVEKVKKDLGVLALQFDLSLTENISAKAKESIAILGGSVDALINNAGLGVFGSIDELNIKDFHKVFNTNVFGLALLTKKIVANMKAQNQGTIINIGSSASVKGFKYGSIYSASKFALRGLSQCWQAELRPFNIRVCQVNPSEVTTAFAQENRKERQELDNKLAPEEIAHTIIALLEMRNKGYVPEVNVWATNPF
jgi:3-oxoacyl-[acyl-carrier protein] reductase